MEPTFVRAFASAPVAAAPAAASAPAATPAGPSTALPKDFDLSRFGPHVQAAYRGPTKDNPSLSLKYRLRRAAALDQMARKTGKTGAAAAKPAEAPRPAERANGEFLLRRPTIKPGGEPSTSPAFTKWPKADPVR
jgi:resuscitation-promoting factor RpfA